MKKFLMLLCALTLVFGMMGTASAVPFQISNSSLDVNWNWGGGGGVTYNPYSMSSPVNLDTGGSFSYTFGTIYVPLALGTGTATLTVDFLNPEPAGSVSDDGDFSVFSFWFFSAGSLNFGSAGTFDYSYNGATGGLMTVDFDNLSGVQLGSWVDITGTITNNLSPATASATAPVPEPSTILLMGTGLLGLVAYGRKRYHEKVFKRA